MPAYLTPLLGQQHAVADLTVRCAPELLSRAIVVRPDSGEDTSTMAEREQIQGHGCGIELKRLRILLEQRHREHSRARTVDEDDELDAAMIRYREGLAECR